MKNIDSNTIVASVLSLIKVYVIYSSQEYAMGMFRESDDFDAELVKEMAEGLGSQGLKLESILEKIDHMKRTINILFQGRPLPPKHKGPTTIPNAIKEHNFLVDQAQDALRWLLIQREACGFRTHRNVERFYPIPEKIEVMEP